MKLLCEVPNSLTMRFFLTKKILILDNIEGYSDDIENERELVYKFCCITAHEDNETHRIRIAKGMHL